MRRWTMAAVAVLGLLETGCIVQVTKVADPRPLFDQARLEAGRLAGRKGPAREVNVLVYDPRDEQLVRVSVPMWLVRKLERGKWSVDVGDESEDVARVLRKRIRLEDIERAGLGTFVEVDEEDGEQVLVWLK